MRSTLPLILLPILLISCSTLNSSSQWENIGTISNGNIHVYINKDNFKKNGNIIIFQDKKVVIDLNKNVSPTLPHIRQPLPNGKSIATIKHTA